MEGKGVVHGKIPIIIKICLLSVLVFRIEVE